MSEERRHTGDQDEFVRAAFNNWDAGDPADQWQELDEALSLESVWTRIDHTMADEANTVDTELRSAFESWEPEMETDGWNRLDHTIPGAANEMDARLRASYASWQPQAAPDGWNKLNDVLSIEQVWMQLQQSLELPVTTRIPFVKLIAATIAMLFMVSSLCDTPVVQHRGESLAIEQQTTSDHSGIARGTSSQYPSGGFVARQQADDMRRGAENPLQVLPSDPSERTQSGQLANNDVRSADQHAEQPDNNNIHSDQAAETEADILAIVDPLGLKSLNTPAQPLVEQHFRFIQRFSPWTIQVGTQLSSLRESDHSRLTSFRPRFGLAADISFRHRVGPVQLIHAFGVSQYSQDVGKYTNGRYANTRQHINSLQLSSCIGYTHHRYTIYGGVLFSNVLNGLEQNQSNNAITKVYNFKAVQLGMTGGVDVRVLSFPSIGKQVSLGIQYQWIPNLGGSAAAFDHIHGIRIQTKFSF